MAEVNRRPNPKVPALRGKTVCNVFFEDSTRTRLSFETAAKRLSADTMTFAVAQSSVNKGESLRDTIETIAAMGVDAFVIRHKSSGAPWLVDNWTNASVINAGDGWHAHPTQALLDAYTVRTALNRTGGFDGLRVAIVGDIKHSRVARSTSAAFRMLGADVTLVAPRTLLPPTVDEPTSEHLDELIGDIDVLYLLRMQQERMNEALVPSLREYTMRFGLTAERAARLAPHALVMHPGPMNRGVEITVDPAELPGRRHHPAGHQRDRRADGRAVRPARGRTVIHDTSMVEASCRADREDEPMTAILIRGGRLLDQTGERDGDVRDRRRSHRERRRRPGQPRTVTTVVDAVGCIVSPGFVDLHVHLREPGKEEAETIETGSRAAALGGFTAIVAMPNTDPTQDCVEVVDFVRRQGVRAGLCEVLPAAAITVGRHGDQVGSVRRARCGRRADLHRRRQRRAGPAADAAGVRVLARPRHHARPALRGRPPDRGRGDARGIVLQPIRPARLALDRRGADGPPRHRARPADGCAGPLPTPVDRGQRRPGASSQGRRTPGHRGGGASPLQPDRRTPRRIRRDVQGQPAVADGRTTSPRSGRASPDGTIDAIATDHAPHARETKEQPLDQAPPGMLGLETSLGVSLAHLDMPLVDVIAALSWKPAAIAGVADRHGRPIEVGEPANLTVFDPSVEWEVVPARLASKSRNTPYVGTPLRGRVRHTIFDGQLVVRDGTATR